MKKLFALCTLAFFVSCTSTLFGQNTYYWVGGSGDWGEGIHWSNTSGGLGGSYILPPSPLDDVVFDAGSGFGPGNNTVTTTISGITCRNMSWLNAPGNPIFDENPETDFVLTGNLILQQNMTFRAQVLFIGNNPATITSNGGKIGGNIYIDKPGTSVTLMDSLMLYSANPTITTSPTLSRTGTIVLIRGTFSLNGHTAYANGFVSEGANVRHLDIANSKMYFRKLDIGPYNANDQYVNASGVHTITNYNFVFTGSNRTISAANSTIRTEYCYHGINISGTPQLTFHNFEYGQSGTGLPEYNTNATYTSIYSNSIVNKITLENTSHHYISSTAGARIDTVYFGTQHNVVVPFNGTNKFRGIVSSPSTIFKLIEFRGINNSTYSQEVRDRVSGAALQADKIIFNTTTTNPNFTRHSLETTSNSQINYVFFRSRGNLSGNNNNIRFIEYDVNGLMQGTNNIMDTLVFSPGYTYRFGVGVTNTVNGKWYANGNPCYYTEIYNVGASSTATVILNQSDPSDFDYIRVWGLNMAGSSSPINAGARSVDIANNTNINFAPYNPLLLLHPFGFDTVARCHTDFPFTLNTLGFFGNTNTNFTWQDGSTLDSFVVMQPGIYSATADYGRNCYFTATVNILDQLSVAINPIAPTVCDPSNPIGSLSAVPGGAGQSTYTYSWNSTPVQTTQVLTGVPVGNYTVTVSDTLGCSISETAEIAGPAVALNVTAGAIYPDCGTAPTGTGYVTPTVTGGIAPYTYVWNTTPVQTTAYASNLTAGTYQLVVTDSLGCTDTLSVVVPAHVGGFTSSIAVTNPTGCNQNGSAVVTINGGTSPFEYLWSNDALETTNTSAAIPVGSHNVLVVDANNCTSNNPFAIIAPDNVAPVFTNCPVDTLLTTGAGCGRVYTWTAPTVTDNCSVSTVTSTHTSGTNFPVGLTTVTYTATDIFGNQSTCSFTITVEDKENPKFALCPTDITLTANAGNCTATANWPTPVVTDNCGVASVVGDFSPGSVFPVGVTTVTYTATDNNGNVEECSFDVIVKANPANFTVSGCPGNRTINLSSAALMSPTDSCAALVALNSPTVNNLCGNWWYGTGANSYAGGNTYTFPVGVTPVTYYITNGADTLTCNYNVTVNDTWYPFIVPGTTPTSGQYIYVTADTTCNGAYATWTHPTFADNCGIASITSTYQPGDFFNYGTTSVMYTVTDVNGRVNNFYLYVNVTNPNTQLNGCPPNINIPSNACGGAIATWTPPTAIDNCYTLTSTHNPGDLFPVGTTMVQYTLTPNDGGTTRTCTFYVTVQAPTNQVANCPSNINVSLPVGVCDTVLTWIAPQFNSFCTIDSVVSNYTPGETFSFGLHPVNYTAYLSNGQTLVCNFNINVTAAQAPITVVDCPPYHPMLGANGYVIQVDTTALCNAAVMNWTPPSFVTSACISAIDTVVYTSSNGIHPGDTLNVYGFSYIQYIAQNGAGQTLASCGFYVHVIDTISQVTVSSCPTDTFVQVNSAFSCDSAIVNFTVPQFTSVGCSPDVDTVIITAYNTSNWIPFASHPGDTLAVGTYYFEIMALDTAGNHISGCNFEIVIGDTLQSVVNDCPGVWNTNYGTYVYEVDIDPATCVGIWDWPIPSFSSIGSCAGVVDQVNQTQGPTWGNQIFSPTQQWVTYQAVDINGFELANCQFLAVASLPDSVSFNIPSTNEYVFYTNPVTCQAIVNWQVPTTTGACGFGSSVGVNTYSQNWWANGIDPYQNSANQSFPIGTYTVQYYMQDGFTTYHNVTIHVYDGAQPTFNATCPTDTMVLNTNFNVCEATVGWPTPVATGGICSGSQTLPIVTTHQQGTTLPIGYSTVTYTATTLGGLTATCEFVVEVIDNQAPSIYVCPSDITVQADANCGRAVSWSVPAVFDNCQNATMTASHVPGDVFPIGVTTVTYTATDDSGNTSTCSFNVTVVDNTNPVFAGCPSNINVSSQTGVCGAVVTWNAPTVTDACNVTLTESHSIGDVFPIGTTTVTYTATDDNGNVSTCSFTVTVTDQTAPVISGCPSDITINNDADECGAVATWTEPTSTDECTHTLVASHNPGDLFPIGTTTVTYTATDSSGNVSTCSFVVTVIDNQLSVITGCPSDINVDSQDNICGAIVTWTEPTATDNCSNMVLTSSHNSGDEFPIGTTTVTYTATDAAGNVVTCSFDVTVTDVTLPVVLNCPTDISINALHNICAAPAFWSTPTVVDPCSNSSITSSHQSGELFDVGTTTVSYTITDGAGNQATCSFDVTVSDVSAPQITSCPQNQIIEVEKGSCSVVAGWSTPIAIDNCSGVTLVNSHNSSDTFAIGTTQITYIATDDQGLQAVCSFTITVIDPNGYCGDSEDSVFIKVPQAITPDGDGVNDFLVIPGIENFPDNELIIFNRWGNEVYKQVEYANQWDGFLNIGTGLEGSQLPTGTYFYVLDTKDKKIGVLKGFIYLQR